MATKKQISSNQQNAKKSTGPKTDQGRQKSAQNARKHGLYSEQFLLDVENKEAYELFHAQLLDDYAPQTATEIILIEQMAASHFLSRRALCAMADVSNGREVSGRLMGEKYPALMRIKNSSDRTVQRCIEQLRLIAKERALAKTDPPARPLLEDPATLQKWLPLQGTGFVPSVTHERPDPHQPSQPDTPENLTY